LFLELLVDKVSSVFNAAALYCLLAHCLGCCVHVGLLFLQQLDFNLLYFTFVLLFDVNLYLNDPLVSYLRCARSFSGQVSLCESSNIEIIFTSSSSPPHRVASERLGELLHCGRNDTLTLNGVKITVHSFE